VFKLDREAFPQWRAGHRALCPPSIASLIPYMDRFDLRDPYGEPYVLLCDPESGTHVVLSAGEDGRFNTTDDLRSD